MANVALDALPPLSWFFGFDLSAATIIIALIGIIHPVAYIYSILHRHDKYREDLKFVFAWCLTGLWFFLSFGLFFAVLISWELVYECWVWYSFVFSISMTLIWGFILYKYLYCRTRTPPPHRVLARVLILLFYLMTIYFVFVVNTRRMKVFSRKNDDPKSLKGPVPKLPHARLPDLFK